MTPVLTRFMLTMTAIFAIAAPLNMAFAASDKGNIPLPPILSKEDPAQRAARDSSQASANNNASDKSVTAEKTAEKSSLYWYDGKRKRMLSLDSDMLADFGSDPQRPAAKPKMIDRTTASQMKAQSDSDQASAVVSPMFKDATSGQTTGALPGGVMVRTLRPMAIDTVMIIARAFGSSVVRPLGTPVGSRSGSTTGTADGAHDFWLFEADAGLAALELANRIHESGQVSSAAPNWWKPRQLK